MEVISVKIVNKMNIMKHHYVYKIVNTLTAKYYYGVHYGELDDDYYGSGKAIKAAIEKHGKEYFEKDIVAICKDREFALTVETGVIGDLWKTDDCYNCKPGGEGGWPSPKGKKLSGETRAKISAGQLGKKFGPRSDETRAKISATVSAAQKGKKRKPLSDEHRAAISAAKKGKKRGPYKKRS
jgi:hypothetical protein